MRYSDFKIFRFDFVTTSSGNVLTDIEGIFMQDDSLAVTSSLS